jgi:hypothetical protein
MPVFRLCIALIAAFGLCLAAQPAFAQKDKKPKIEWEDWSGEGTVVGVRGRTLGMLLRGEQWVGVVAPVAKVAVTGTADKDVLRPGVVVRLNAEFDRKTNTAIEPVKQLEIVTPRPGDRTGFISDEEIGGKSKGLPPPTLKLQIFDAISAVKDNTLTFKRYKVELAPDVSIKVDVSDASILSQGDEVTKVKGKRIKGTRGQLMIGELEAKLMKPLSAPKRRAPQSAATARGPAKGAAQTDLFNVAGDEATGKKSEPQQEQKQNGKNGGKKQDDKKANGKKNNDK